MDLDHSKARSGSGTSATPAPTMTAVTFRKGRQRWTFRFEKGQERDMIEVVRGMMREGRGLDWVDVAIITHKLRLLESVRPAA